MLVGSLCAVCAFYPAFFVVSLTSGAPLPPINVTRTDCGNLTTNLSWAMRLTPDLPPPLSFIIEMRSKIAGNSGSPWPAPFSKLAVVSDGSTRSYVVKHLRPYNEIQFRVRATNQLGTGFPGLLKTSCNTRSSSEYRRKLSTSTDV